METPIFLASLLLLAKGCEVTAQCLVSQFTPSLCATSCLQSPGQFSIPAILTPIIPRTESTPAPPIETSCADYSSYPCVPPPMPMPPVIITRDNDNNDFLLYFLLFALSKKKQGNFGYGCGSNGGGGNGCGGNGCGGNGCGGNGCGGNGCSCGTNGCGGGYAYGGNSFSNCCGNYGNSLNNCGSDFISFPYPMPCPTDSTSTCPSFSYPDNISSLLNCYSFPGFAFPSCNGGCQNPTVNLVISGASQSDNQPENNPKVQPTDKPKVTTEKKPEEKLD